MIPLEQIQHIKQEADLKQVVESLGVELRRAGANWVGRCPFHNEKTGSFTVHPRNNHWKCYGCGEGGNAIDFVIKKKGCDFIEAAKYVADLMGYTLTDDYHETAEQKQVRERKMQQVEVNKLAVVWFQQQLRSNKKAKAYVEERGWNEETVQQWEIGYAPDDWNALFDWLRKEKHVAYDTLTRSTLFGKGKNGTYYCKFRDRLMFPILNSSGDPVAFSGRLVPWHETKEGQKESKYVNSSGDEQAADNIYIKGETLFGWNFARAEAARQGEVVLVEGNPDTIKMHQIGVTNVVAACGTALTTKQAQTLAKSVRRAVLLYDSDKAGQKATEKNGRVLLEAGVMVYTLTIPETVDETTGELKKQDPDTYFESAEQFREFSKSRKSWFVFVAERRKEELGKEPDPAEVSQVAGEMAKLLLSREEGERMVHIDQLAKIIPPKKVWNAALKQVQQKTTKELNSQGFTKEQQQMIDDYGFFVRDHCYQIISDVNGGYRQVSNFELEPLFHIESTINAKRLYRLMNNRGVVRELEIAQRDLVSLSAFKTKVESFGNFLFTGSDTDLNKIKAYLYERTKTCREVEQLGWQKEGFWAWSNGVIDDSGEMRSIDELGSVEVGKQWYYLPALSSFFKADTQLFQFERRFIHTAGRADLYTLASKMLEVYGENAIVGLGYYMTTLFRDVVFNKFNHFPILNLFGERGSGKTEMAITLMQLFGNQGSGPNINTATIPAVADHLSHCRNAMVHLEEYKNSMEYEKIEILKGAFDGIGRSRMNMDRDKKKEMVPVDCGIILTGQESTTADNALFTRVIYLTVKKRVHTDKETEAYNDLKQYEKQGLTCITNELLTLRDYILAHYEEQLANTEEELRQAVNTKRMEDRILISWKMVLAMLRTIGQKVTLPWSYEQAIDVFAKGMEQQQEAVTESNAVAQFWSVVETLLTNGDIETNYDLKLYFSKSNIKCYKGTGAGRKELEYSQTLDVIYLNTSRVFSLYAKQMKATQSNKAQTADTDSMIRILKAQDEYMGECVKQFRVPTRLRDNPNDGKSFTESGSQITALQKANRSLVFNYAKLVELYGIDLNVQSNIDEDSEAANAELPY